MFSATSTKPSTFLFVFAICQLFTATVTCAPVPIPNPNPDTTDQINNSYSGAGGRTSGGSVTTNPSNPNFLGGMGLLDLASGNAGGGGIAKSGSAVPDSGPVTIAGHGSTTTDPNSSSSGSTTHSEVDNAYSGAGGIAEGGGVNNNPALIRLFSGNSGKGGDSSSGSSGPTPIVLSNLGTGPNLGSSPRRGGRTRAAKYYKVNLD